MRGWLCIKSSSLQELKGSSTCEACGKRRVYLVFCWVDGHSLLSAWVQILSADPEPLLRSTDADEHRQIDSALLEQVVLADRVPLDESLRPPVVRVVLDGKLARLLILKPLFEEQSLSKMSNDVHSVSACAPWLRLSRFDHL